jgi:hypothetical protein
MGLSTEQKVRDEQGIVRGRSRVLGLEEGGLGRLRKGNGRWRGKGVMSGREIGRGIVIGGENLNMSVRMSMSMSESESEMRNMEADGGVDGTRIG